MKHDPNRLKWKHSPKPQFGPHEMSRLKCHAPRRQTYVTDGLDVRGFGDIIMMSGAGPIDKDNEPDETLVQRIA